MINRQILIAVLIATTLGVAVGVGAYTFLYAKGGSYLTNNPAACANCHIMSEQYSGWLKGSHRSIAGCNDCHTPPGLISKYITKASNGFWHSYGFTTGRFHEPIQIKSHNREITEKACRKCHAEIVEAMVGIYQSPESVECIRCHASVGHMR
jgi:cytochrome c nitrite reductase small subunit